MEVAIYPGSFDPITNGHIDIINRACQFVNQLYVGVMVNCNKNYLFSLEERKQLIEQQFSHHPKVKVISFDGLLIDYMRKNNIKAIIKGLRTVTDYNYETQMALINKNLYKDVETFFILSREEYSFISSSLVKEVHLNGGDVSAYLPEHVEKALNRKVQERAISQGEIWENQVNMENGKTTPEFDAENEIETPEVVFPSVFNASETHSPQIHYLTPKFQKANRDRG